MWSTSRIPSERAKVRLEVQYVRAFRASSEPVLGMHSLVVSCPLRNTCYCGYFTFTRAFSVTLLVSMSPTIGVHIATPRSVPPSLTFVTFLITSIRMTTLCCSPVSSCDSCADSHFVIAFRFLLQVPSSTGISMHGSQYNVWTSGSSFF